MALKTVRRLFSTLCIASLPLLAYSTAAQAQTGIYAQFTGQSNDLNSSSGWFWGATFGFYQDRHSVGPVHLGVDFRGAILKHDQAQFDSGLGGLRLTVVPHVVPFKIYAEALGGVGIVSNGPTNTHAQYQVNGGLEYTILPRIDWRVAEIAYNGYSGTGTGNPVGLSSGLVFRLP
ncbi:hypothetical protein [Terriglobus roseus]|uniref:Outer membrane protein beta-barrel domain-containing protein n=1 Tax=Terriglobus roseus TaxID=392734 RepID=A0A1H4SNW0_9BACT|nr:hypothetical protein [Terriglobus roseus]SEC45684.1 hypothetical protein SAMN05443244_3504 [Terriglobus roseus]